MKWKIKIIKGKSIKTYKKTHTQTHTHTKTLYTHASTNYTHTHPTQTHTHINTQTSHQYIKASSVKDTVLALCIDDVRLDPEGVVLTTVPTPLKSPPLDRLRLPTEEGMVQWMQRVRTPSHLHEGDTNPTLPTCLARRFCLVALRMELCASSFSFPLMPPPLCVDDPRLDPTERSR